MPKLSRDKEPPITIQRPFKRETINFNGADFHTAFWSVPDNIVIKGRILFVHGFCEYYKVYIRIAQDLVEAGYEVFLFDQRGSGLTSSEKGITNEFHTFNDLNHFIELNLKDMAIKSCKKLFLCGHSMGGGIALNYGIHGKYKDQLNGIAVTGPLIELHPASKPSKLLFEVLSIVKKVLPNMKVDTKLKPKHITSDLNWRSWFFEDDVVMPLSGSLTQIDDLIKRGHKLLDASYNKSFSKPVLICHGENDKINSPKASKDFIETIPIKDKKLVYIKDGRHALLIEKEEIYRTVINTFLNWFDTH